ncbi:MAG: exodeoxyribonuclease VII small subunit [Tenericutes bacterium]|nr:exodeoxyribonuclease VII small subunit [Mycoplasmatota bacterium]
MSEKKEMKFEDQVRELEKIVSELESGELGLDEAIVKYTEAMKLIDFCEKKLNSATETINKLVEENGKITDFKIDE